MSGVSNISNCDVIYDIKICDSIGVPKESEQDTIPNCFKVVIGFAIPVHDYKRSKGNYPIPTTLSLYTIRVAPSNHFLCSKVPSTFHWMILHTTIIIPYWFKYTTLSDVATPQITFPSVPNYASIISPYPLHLPTSLASQPQIFAPHPQVS